MVNFLPNSKKGNTDEAHSAEDQGGIEYSTIEETETPKPQKPKPEKKKKDASFSLWRKRNQQPASVQPSPPPAPTVQEKLVVPDVAHTSAVMPAPAAETQKPVELPTQSTEQDPVMKFPFAPSEDMPIPAGLPSSIDALQPVAPVSAPQPELQPEPIVQPKPEKKKKEKKQSRPKNKKKAKKKAGPAWQQPDMLSEPIVNLGVNLIPGQAAAEPSAIQVQLRKLLIVAVCAVVVLAAAYVGVRAYRMKVAQKTIAVQEQIADTEKQIAQYSAVQQQAKTLNEQLEAAAEVMDAHIYWTPFFEKVLEPMTLPTVYYQNMSGSVLTGVFTLDTVAPEYEHIDAQLKLFQQSPYVRSATATSTVRVQPAVQEEKASTSGEATQEEPAPSTSAFKLQSVITVEFDPALFHFTKAPVEQSS